MTSFDQATAVERLDDTRFAWSVPDGWQQGRGCFGGIVVGALLRAISAAETDAERTIRTVAGHIMAPAVVGRHVIDVTCARRGTAVSTWDASLRDGDGRSIAAFSAMLGAPRVTDSGIDFESMRQVSPPTVPGAGEVPRLHIEQFGGPTFAQHMDFRPIAGIPGSSAAAEITAWVDFAEPVDLDAIALLSLVDAAWPASLAALPAMRPVATVSFAANLVADPATVRGPLLHHGLVSAAREGFTSEHRRLWTQDGRLVVDNLQSIVVVA